jgi:hypothetical protein
LAEVYGNLVIVVILVMEGVVRAALRITALTLDGWGSGEHEGSQPLPVVACAVTDLCLTDNLSQDFIF